MNSEEVLRIFNANVMFLSVALLVVRTAIPPAAGKLGRSGNALVLIAVDQQVAERRAGFYGRAATFEAQGTGSKFEIRVRLRKKE